MEGAGTPSAPWHASCACEWTSGKVEAKSHRRISSSNSLSFFLPAAILMTRESFCSSNSGRSFRTTMPSSWASRPWKHVRTHGENLTPLTFTLFIPLHLPSPLYLPNTILAFFSILPDSIALPASPQFSPGISPTHLFFDCKVDNGCLG